MESTNLPVKTNIDPPRGRRACKSANMAASTEALGSAATQAHMPQPSIGTLRPIHITLLHPNMTTDTMIGPAREHLGVLEARAKKGKGPAENPEKEVRSTMEGTKQRSLWGQHYLAAPLEDGPVMNSATATA